MVKIDESESKYVNNAASFPDKAVNVCFVKNRKEYFFINEMWLISGTRAVLSLIGSFHTVVEQFGNRWQ